MCARTYTHSTAFIAVLYTVFVNAIQAIYVVYLYTHERVWCVPTYWMHDVCTPSVICTDGTVTPQKCSVQ